MSVKEKILMNLTDLPTLPTAVTRLATLISSADATARDFEAVIQPDPALTTNLLRLANSAYFGLRKEISSVRQAVALLGSKRVFEVAASAGFSQVIPRRLPGYDIGASDFWTHCIAVAVISETLAKELNVSTPQMLFTAGLLHDLGKLAVAQYLGQNEQQLFEGIREHERVLIHEERILLGTDHGEMGKALADAWDLPDVISWTAAWHHEPEQLPDDVEATTVDLVHIADVVAHLIGYGTDTGELHRRLSDVSVERVGFKKEYVETLSAQTFVTIEEMKSVLS